VARTGGFANTRKKPERIASRLWTKIPDVQAEVSYDGAAGGQPIGGATTL